MAVSEKGANYVNRTHIQNRDRLTSLALDDIISKVQAVADQTNASVSGETPAPPAPTAVSVVNASGSAQLLITNPGAAKNTAYIIEYSSTPNFLNPQIVDNGFSPTFERYLAGQTLYFRVAATLYTSPQSGWTYFGPAANPTPTTF